MVSDAVKDDITVVESREDDICFFVEKLTICCKSICLFLDQLMIRCKGCLFVDQLTIYCKDIYFCVDKLTIHCMYICFSCDQLIIHSKEILYSLFTSWQSVVRTSLKSAKNGRHGSFLMQCRSAQKMKNAFLHRLAPATRPSLCSTGFGRMESVSRWVMNNFRERYRCFWIALHGWSSTSYLGENLVTIKIYHCFVNIKQTFANLLTCNTFAKQNLLRND